ncbi:MAG: DNA polymerase III subunit [Parachlamydiaceae bacterium]|nr:DNA polymerase III subunit [Parachlamydiaceae bacterium]
MSLFPTDFDQIKGNEKIKQQLTSMVNKQKIGHSLLFVGTEGIGKSLFAMVLAAKIMGQGLMAESQLKKIQDGVHPDIHVYRPEGKLGMHSIQSMRQLGEEVNYPPFEAEWKVFIIHEADRMLSYSANALLKTFEEPPPRTLIILLSRSSSILIPTLLSRCRVVHFQSLSVNEITKILQEKHSISDSEAQEIAIKAEGSIERAIRLVEQGENPIRKELLNFLAACPLDHYRHLQEKVKSLNDRVEEIKLQIENAAKEELKAIPKVHLSLHQLEMMEKELEGVISLVTMQEAKSIFDDFLAWFRDKEVLKLGGEITHLKNRDYHEALVRALKTQKECSLKDIYSFVEEAQLSLQRSTSFSIVLETLFLKVHGVRS